MGVLVNVNQRYALVTAFRFLYAHLPSINRKSY